jgi:hypothetical protein
MPATFRVSTCLSALLHCSVIQYNTIAPYVWLQTMLVNYQSSMLKYETAAAADHVPRMTKQQLTAWNSSLTALIAKADAVPVTSTVNQVYHEFIVILQQLYCSMELRRLPISGRLQCIICTCLTSVCWLDQVFLVFALFHCSMELATFEGALCERSLLPQITMYC